MSPRLPSTLRSPRQLAHLALCLLLLCAMGVQQWAVQSHWHAAAASGAQVAADAPAGDSGEGLPGHDCLWCQVASHAGSAAPPLAWAAVADVTVHSFLLRSAADSAAFVSTPAWAWQSRGPPAA